VAERSYEPICISDLSRLGELAAGDRASFFRRNPDTARLYADRLVAVALCQGAALHFLHGQNGVKDFDVWSFYAAHPERPFPYRRRGIADFGDPKFGTSDDSPAFIGRRVDLLGRSIEIKVSDPVSALRDYLREGTTASARFLAQKAVIMIAPTQYLGVVVWPDPPRRAASLARDSL